MLGSRRVDFLIIISHLRPSMLDAKFLLSLFSLPFLRSPARRDIGGCALRFFVSDFGLTPNGRRATLYAMRSALCVHLEWPTFLWMAPTILAYCKVYSLALPPRVFPLVRKNFPSLRFIQSLGF